MRTRLSVLAASLLAFATLSETACDRTPPPTAAKNNPTVPTKRRRVPFDESRAVTVGAGRPESPALENPPEAYGFAQSLQIGSTLQRDALQGGTLVQGRSGWIIQDGDFRLKPADARRTGLEPALKVDTYEPVENQVVCQLDVSPDKKWFFGEKGFDNDRPIRLIGDQGNEFTAIGFSYLDANDFAVRYTPGTPLKGLADLPQPLSRSNSDQKVKLIFRVSRGVTLQDFRIGSKVLQVFDPKIELKDPQR